MERVMQDVKLEMTLEEAVGIVNLLGKLPTENNAYGLWKKLREQVEAQMPKQEVKEAA